jgi:flagellar motor switch protein FliG
LEGLIDEQPQLIAATLAGASPLQAADLLDRLPVELQAEVLRRMACLDRLPSKWPASLWEELERRQQVQSGAPVRFARESLTAVRKILDAHGSHERAALLEYLTRTEPRLAERLADLAGDDSPPGATCIWRGST